MEGLFAPTHLLVLLGIVLLLFGGKKIPELMRGVGQGVGELQKGLNEAKSKMNVSMDQEAATPAPRSETAALEGSKPVAPVPNPDSQSVAS
jgi:sec-independent protein translocase protein TatA